MTKEYLSKWINELIRQDRMYRFYNSAMFKHLRQEVFKQYHYECQECLKKKPKRYTRATVCHHVIHVEDRPDLAMSKYIKDINGNKVIQIEPVCARCHNKLHPEKGWKMKTYNEQKKDDKTFFNKERW